MLRRKAMRRAGFRPTPSRLARTKLKASRTKPASRANVPAEVVEAVRVRDGGICQRCGAWLANVPSGGQHHRKPRARMGKHTLANLVTVCLACHDEIHRGDTRQAADDGWLLSAMEYPAGEAALTYLGWRAYLDDGSVTPVAGRRWGAQA